MHCLRKAYWRPYRREDKNQGKNFRSSRIMMLLKREGWPEEGEIVICTVTRILPNSVFANIDEYRRSGMIHISEVAPGRIRNIRDYVSEGRVVVCQILQVNREKGHIDLSLRRVSEIAKRKKLEEVKLEQKAEKN